MELSGVQLRSRLLSPCDFLDCYSTHTSNKQSSRKTNYALLCCNINKGTHNMCLDGVTSSKDGNQLMRERKMLADQKSIMKQKAGILEFKEENMSSTPIFLQSPFNQMKNLSIHDEVGVRKGKVLREGRKVAILAYGSTVVENCVTAAALLQVHGILPTVAEALLCETLDGDLITRLAQHHQFLLTVEEGSAGSVAFASQVSHFLALKGLLDRNLKGDDTSNIINCQGLVLPEKSCVKQGSYGLHINSAALTVKQIASAVLSLVADDDDVFLIM